ncbi:hypothetical protein [Salinicoccus roseus]|uniref:Uncharacterized protein n=1 Tax=Salinicoccus roseus TaxID=45670 RepID=A0A0C2HEL3_9STAP|nr:hypothetical protein [Salinicoccus roseus]KIH70074.1 hypothetical protein SN16_11295 [Salinicoccus roseus]MDB0581389.1 hypothetical protein [Salinicoccus roseus]
MKFLKSIMDGLNIYTLSILEDNFKKVDETIAVVESLIAKGQLTEEQYANLITIVNGMIKSGEVGELDLSPKLRAEVNEIKDKIDKGDVSVKDINKNYGLLDSTYFSSGFLADLNGGVIDVTNVLPGSIRRSHVVKYAISPDKTDFFKKTGDNLFEGYTKGILTKESTGGETAFFFTSEYDLPEPHDGRLVIVPIDNNEDYSLTVHGDHDQFRAAGTSNHPVIPEGYAREEVPRENILIDDKNLSVLNFNSGNYNYLSVYVSSSGQEPKIQMNKGNQSSVYSEPFILPKSVVERQQQHNIVVEDASGGYGHRPEVPSVVYFGVNPPHDAEPFDEWRELSGFPYVLDFKTAQLTDFTLFGVDTSVVSISTDSYDGTSALKYDSTEATYQGLVWDNISDNYMNDQEIFMEVRAAANNYRPASTLHRFDEDVNGELSYYAVGYYNGSLDIMKKEVGTGNQTLESVSKTIDATLPFRIRSRVTEDGFISAKIWQSTDSEPPEWDIEFYDISLLPQTNKLGIYAYTGFSNIRALGVSTGGMTAPKRKWW